MFNLGTLFILAIVAVATVRGSRSIRTGYSTDSSGELQEGNNFCQGCRNIVSFAHQFNSTTNRAEHKDLFLNFCELYYPVSTDYQQGPCPLFIESLYYLFGKIDPVSHCDDIGACATTSSESYPIFDKIFSPSNDVEQVRDDDGIFCSTCEQVFNNLKQQLEDPKVEAQIKEQLRQLCEYLKVVGQDKECVQILSKYVDQAFDFIRAIDAKKYCQSIQLCNRKQERLRPKFKSLPTLADFNNFGIEESVKVDGLKLKDVSASKKTPNCSFCKAFVKEMFRFLKDNRTEETVRDGLDRVCKLVYHDSNKLEQCENLVATYSKQFVELLIDETDPELICMIVGQCVYHKQELSIAVEKPKPIAKQLMQTEPIGFSHFMSMLDSQIKVGSMRSCVECKLFVKYLQSAIEDPKSQEQVKDWLINNLCLNLGESELKNSCVKMVDENSATFFLAIADQLNPKFTCVELGACKNRGRNILRIDNLEESAPPRTLEPEEVAPPKKVESSTRPTDPLDLYLPSDPMKIIFQIRSSETCQECENLVTKFDEYLSSHSIEQDVQSLIDEVCDNIPNKEAKDNCAKFVKTYGQIIVHAVESMDSPKELCASIFLC